MIKLIGFLTRKPGMSVADFQTYWRDVHAPMIARSPGLLRYIQSHACPEVYDTYPPAYDGAAEAWFDDMDAFNAAVASPGWQDAIADVGNFMAPGGGRLFATEVPIIDALPSPQERAGMVKFMGLLTRRPGLSVDEFQRHWRDIHGPLVHTEFPEMRRYIQCHAIPHTYSLTPPPAYDGVPEAWFDGLDVFPWRMVRREGPQLETAAARDSQNVFLQPIPSIVAREVVIVG
ncbi:MAG TPA: EthD family reductase [Dehalococcoidia bacterium]|nr:EthD family reductase [Dehalococcoidia bacterium]